MEYKKNTLTALLYHIGIITLTSLIFLMGCESENIDQVETSDIWEGVSLEGAPAPRSEHTAIWTGTEMIVWGGNDGNYNAKNTGGRFDPLTNSWATMSTDGTPEARYFHSAIWTGTEMIIWGGNSGYPDFNHLNTGARYNPQTDIWTPIDTLNAPTARSLFTSVWTGLEMIIWGGEVGLNTISADGASYNPMTDTWETIQQTINSPSDRRKHTAVWTGSEMIIWGGEGHATLDEDYRRNTGGAYNPITHTWKPISTINSPLGRYQHVAVWTGTNMIIFGGISQDVVAGFKQGSLYDPMTDSWTSMNTDGAPKLLGFHLSKPAVWADDQFIAWYQAGNAARYNPSTDTWSQISNNNDPSSRTGHTTIWTGSRIVVWGGTHRGINYTIAGNTVTIDTSDIELSVLQTGGIYNPNVDLTP